MDSVGDEVGDIQALIESGVEILRAELLLKNLQLGDQRWRKVPECS